MGALKGVKVALFVVDEAHCISEVWCVFVILNRRREKSGVKKDGFVCLIACSTLSGFD